MQKYNETITKILENPKISRIDTFGTLDGDNYAAIYYDSKNNERYIILSDCNELYRLVGVTLTISTMSGYKYLKINHKVYFHRLVMNAKSDEVVHHAAFSNGTYDTLDCRKSHLVCMSLSEHSQHHCSKPRKRKENQVGAQQ